MFRLLSSLYGCIVTHTYHHIDSQASQISDFGAKFPLPVPRVPIHPAFNCKSQSPTLTIEAGHDSTPASPSFRFRLLENPGLFAVLSRWPQRRARVAPFLRARKPRKQISHSSRETAQAKSNASNEACPDGAIPQRVRSSSYSSVPVNLPTPQTKNLFLLYNI